MNWKTSVQLLSLMPQDPSFSLRASSKILALGLGLAVTGMTAQSARAANTTDTYLSTTATDWSTASWSTGAPPVSSNDVLFATGSSATSTITGENFNIGSFNSTIAEAVTNASTTTASLLTLGGGSATTDQVSGSNPADLIYVTANSSLGLTAGTGALNIALGQAGQFDAVGGTLTIGLAAGGSTLSLGGFTLTATGTSNIQINSVVSDGSTTSAGSILKTGANTFVLNTANTYTGTTTIEQGILNGGNATSFGNATSAIALGDATSITGNLSVYLQLGGTANVARNITVGASNGTTTGTYTIGTGNNAAGAIPTINGTVTLNQNLIVNSANAGFNLQGSVTSGSTGTQTVTLTAAGTGAQADSTNIGGGTGTIAVTKAGAGTGVVTLSGANTYTGATKVTTGTLQAGSATAFGVASAVTLTNAANVILALNNNNVTIGSLTGGGTTGGNVTLGTGTLSLGSDNTSPAAYAGVISGTGNLTKVGTGTASISGTNTYTGTTTVESGILNPSVAGALGNATSAIALGDATSITSNLSPSLLVSGVTTIARNITVGASNAATTGVYTIGSGNAGSAAQISGAVTLNQNVTVSSAGAAFTLSGNVTSGATGTQTVTLSNAGVQTDSGAIGGGTGAIALIKNGAGNATLSGANNYTGTTTVNTGILTVTSTLGSGAVTVTGGTLLTSGTGTLGLGNSVTVAGVGVLTLGNSTSLSSAQALNFAGTTTINLNNGTTDTLANIVDTDSGSTFVPTPGTTYTAAQLDTDFSVNSFMGNGTLTIAAVPEPSTWAGGLVLLGGLHSASRAAA